MIFSVLLVGYTSPTYPHRQQCYSTVSKYAGEFSASQIKEPPLFFSLTVKVDSILLCKTNFTTFYYVIMSKNL